MNFKGAHFLSINQLERSDLTSIFSIAREMEVYARREKVTRVLEGAILGNLFFEPSTRTRMSFAAAFMRLGGSVSETTGLTSSSIAKGESLEDTSRVISGYADVVVLRHPEQGAIQQFAQSSLVPVINGGDGPGEHPTQALLDLYTIMKESERSFEEIEGLSIAMIGDLKHARTVHSLVQILALFKKLSFTFIAPKELQMPGGVVDQLRKKGHSVQETENLKEGVVGVDVLYVTRIQEERFSTPEEAESHKGRYTMNRDLYQACCRSNTPILHPLPRDSRLGARELACDLDAHPSLAIFRQSDHGVPIRMALFTMLLDVVDQVGKETRAVSWFRRG